MKLNLVTFFLVALPESLALAALSTAIGCTKLNFKIIASIALLYAISTFLVRSVFSAFGVHFVIFIVVLAILLNAIARVVFSKSLLIGIISLLILAVLETLCLYSLSSLTGVNVQQVTQEVNLPFYYAWPHIIIMSILALIISSIKKNAY